MKRAAGQSAYYLCVNRNKRGMTVNLKTDERCEIVGDLARRSDVLVKNFRPRTLTRFSLDFESVSVFNSNLIYCSITGFGQAGSLRDRPGYDFMIQALGGIMSATGEPDDQPMKVGVAVADLFAGQNVVIAILAALQARTITGKSQHLDISLFDSQLGWLANMASNFLISGTLPTRYGNAHANIVPDQSFAVSDGWFVIAVGNDKQFENLCKAIGQPDLCKDPCFETNSARVQNREALIELLKPIFATRKVDDWLALLENDLPYEPINSLDQIFSMPQVEAREMLIEMDHPTIGKLQLVGSPSKFGDTPVEYRIPPPRLGENTAEILNEILAFLPPKLMI